MTTELDQVQNKGNLQASVTIKFPMGKSKYERQ